MLIFSPENCSLTKDALVQHVTALGNVPGAATASMKSVALSGCPSGFPLVPTSGALNLAYAPSVNAASVKTVHDVSRKYLPLIYF